MKVKVIKIGNLASNDPEDWLEEVAFFDTYPANDGKTFNGAWNNYPYFPSGNIAVSEAMEPWPPSAYGPEMNTPFTQAEVIPAWQCGQVPSLVRNGVTTSASGSRPSMPPTITIACTARPRLRAVVRNAVQPRLSIGSSASSVSP